MPDERYTEFTFACGECGETVTEHFFTLDEGDEPPQNCYECWHKAAFGGPPPSGLYPVTPR